MNGQPQSEPNAAPVKNRDENYFKPAWSLVIGAFLSGIIGLVFFMYKRGRDAKDHFLVTFSQLGGELERHENPLWFYQESLPKVQEAVFRLRPFLRKPRAKDLSCLWNLYCAANAQLFQTEDDKIWTQRFYDYFKMPKPKSRKEIIQFFHKKFRKVAGDCDT